MFRLKHGYNVQVHQATKLHPFSLANTGLLHGPTGIAHPMTTDVSEIDAALTYRLRLIYRAVLLRRIAGKNTKKPQARYKRDYDKYVLLKRRFAAGDYVLVERAP